jgi:hypothetical protein
LAGRAVTFLLALSVLGAQGPAPAALAEEAAVFMTGVADLPLMPGLAEVPDSGMVFDKPAGRIVEAYAEGAVSRAAVTAFYISTLPNLGWRAKAEALFQREGELLRLGFMGDDGALVVRFTLQPE